MTQMLRRLGTPKVPADEAVVKSALTPFYVGDTKGAQEREAILGALLRTGTAFVVSTDDVPSFGEDLMDMAWEPWDGLPPLPFPRVWIECGSPTTTDPAAFPLTESGDWGSGLYGVGIVGTEAGWTVAELYAKDPDHMFQARYPWDSAAEVTISVDQIAPDASSHYPFVAEPEAEGWDEDALPNAMGAWRAIMLVQLLDVLGSRHVPLGVPRPHRRTHERKFGVSHPQVYFVDLRATGEPETGAGDRHYHHRWLVRGHWRHRHNGRRTWVRPYVKGPVGAPWRGRPVYVDRGATKGQQDPPRRAEIDTTGPGH